MIQKIEIYKFFKAHIESKICVAQLALAEATESVHSETKGSAGDKHETGRSMAQIEVENLGKILFEAQQMAGILGLLEPEIVRVSCSVGAFVVTNEGQFYLSSGIGKIEVFGETIFCIGMNSPLGQAMIGKMKGEKYVFLGKEIEVIDVF